jgi:hypothetical protein
VTSHFETRLTALSHFLNTHRPLFEERPFIGAPLSWESRFPALSDALKRLSPETVIRYENRPLEHPLTRHLLRLPSLEDVASGDAARLRREREHVFRLGLDLLIREAAGRDVYYPLGRIKPRLFKQGFEAFAKSVAREKQLPLPHNACFDAA